MPVADGVIAERYRFTRRLATGGMGEVWLARDELLRRDVAVKTLHLQPGLAADDRELVLQRALREARITARLHHPNAVQVFDVVEQHDGPALIMEYVPSRSLADVVRTEGPRPIAEAAQVGIQISAALAAAHRAGIVHRDVKPGNVLMAEDGTAKLTDFGISHAFDDVTLTSTGMVTGTPAFLAPEVARGAPSDFASDVYSLGVTLYFALEGESPFGPDTNPMAVLHRVAVEPPRPPRHAGPMTPLLAQLMAPRPADRPHMADIAHRLGDLHLVPSEVAARATEPLAVAGGWQATRQLPAAPPPGPARTRAVVPPPPVLPTGPAPAHRRRRWPLVAAVLAVLAVAGILVGVLVAQSGGDASTGSGAPPTSQASTPASRAGASSARSSASSPATSASSAAPSTDATPSTATTPTKDDRAKNPPAARGKATDADLAAAVTQYFQLVPGNLDAGWARLTTSFQNGRAGGRSTYDDYWNSISRVDVANVQGDAPDAASALLTYHYKDGRTVTQQTRFTFKQQDGVLKIDSES